MTALVAIMLILLVWGLVAGRLARVSVTMPLALLLAGILLTSGSDPYFVFIIDFEAGEHIVEGILAILLFVDATEVPGGIFGREPRVMLRLLLIALPLSLVIAWVAGIALFGGTGLWLLAVLATIVMPVDLAPAAAFIRDRRVPERLRRLVNVESGLNDGLVAPVFLLAIAGAAAHGEDSLADAAADAIPSLAVAVVVGAVIGTAAAWLLGKALDRGWTLPSALRIAVLALPLLAYGTAILLTGNGFVAAFVAGVFFEPAARRLPTGTLHLAEDIGEMLSLALWFIFGTIVNQVVSSGAITWRVVVYALLALTVVRVVPVVLSLIGTDVRVPDRFTIGWVGPRGIATLVFGMLAVVELPGDKDFVLAVTVVTIVASIVVHGLSTGVVIRLYDRADRKSAGPGPSENPDEPGATADR
ncbi:sodium/hydrogen exchanger [Pseudonocardia sulfidoxydans NBRC 16205]|uniref:Sodium/hydrogen exchanger n=1 Tax=Pseudonocardia sulfidoxydans NBRC 16205 TaxID=1223511 RepID=A0A511DIC3_9PSEU|nr:cation:proton antiporter [Pseudonocardia sulfidoxydans]GEL24217.1 sodium/hydrogen exchanger [Pseudonocardia sulfidoxydans NBRC 16205]